MPKKVLAYFESFNSSIVKLPKLMKLEEVEAIKRKEMEEDRKRKSYRAMAFRNVIGIPQGAATSPTLATILLNDTVFKAATSAGYDAKTLMYADDGIYYGNLTDRDPRQKDDFRNLLFNPFQGDLRNTMAMSLEGIKYNKEKSD
ncbi:hypothetical protein ACMFMG_012159 [Clarireedia jacksonii]